MRDKKTAIDFPMTRSCPQVYTGTPEC